MSDSLQEELLETIDGPPTEVLDRLVYVAGSARGGTTITMAVIALHPEILTTGRPSHFLNHVWRYRKVLHDRLWRQLLWTPAHIRRGPVRDALSGERRQAYTRLVNRASDVKDLRGLYRLYPLTLALDPKQTRDPKSYAAWLDKGNDFWGVDQLPKAFPEGRFVLVVRDPRGAVASLAARNSELRADTEFEVEPRDVINSALYWRNVVRQQLRFARRHRSQSILLRFEDLTAQPVAMAQSLYAALGLSPLSEATISAGLDDIFYSTSNDKAEEGKGIRTTPNERWKQRLDPLALRVIETICGRTARALGYEITAPEKRLGWHGILKLVPGRKAKAIVLAKLVFLALTDPRAPRSGSVHTAAPMPAV